MARSCPLLLVQGVPQPSAHHLCPVGSLTQSSRCLKDVRRRHMGQEAGPQPKEMVLAQHASALGPLLPCQFALAQLSDFWEEVSLLRKGCVSELQLA